MLTDVSKSVAYLGWFSVVSILLFGGLTLGFCINTGACMTGMGTYASVCIGFFNASAPICDGGSLAIMGIIASLGGRCTPVG